MYYIYIYIYKPPWQDDDDDDVDVVPKPIKNLLRKTYMFQDVLPFSFYLYIKTQANTHWDSFYLFPWKLGISGKPKWMQIRQNLIEKN